MLTGEGRNKLLINSTYLQLSLEVGQAGPRMGIWGHCRNGYPKLMVWQLVDYYVTVSEKTDHLAPM